MSAIAGIRFSDEKPVSRQQVSKLIAAMRHRGPDGAGIWADGSTGLGHGMLWTTQESLHESLPAWNPCLQLAITADVRIDNRDELVAALEVPHDLVKETPDSTLILLAYERWGESCTERLLGDF